MKRNFKLSWWAYGLSYLIFIIGLMNFGILYSEGSLNVSYLVITISALAISINAELIQKKEKKIK